MTDIVTNLNCFSATPLFFPPRLITRCTNERISSELKTVKSALRNSTSYARLCYVSVLNCEKDLDNADEIDLDNVVEKWAKQVNNMPDV
jgi:hypothetical protein